MSPASLHLSSNEPAREFIVERQVRFSDCDPAGIVFFPNYFVMLNCVVEDWWSHIGKPWTEIISKRRMGTPTAHLDTNFMAPSQFGETLRFCLSVENIGKSSLLLQHRVIGEDHRERLHFSQRLVATSLETHRSVPWPEDIRQAITLFKENP